MPLTPREAVVAPGEPFNFSALRPVGETGDISSLVPSAIGVVMLNDTTLICFSASLGRLIELSMVNGDPSTVTATGNFIGIPFFAGQLSYDHVNSRIYTNNIFGGGFLTYINLVGETIVGATIGANTFPVAATWGVGVSQDGTNIYTGITGPTQISRYTFGVPGDVSTLVLQQQNSYNMGGGAVSILVSDNSLRLITAVSSSVNTFGLIDMLSPNDILAGATPPNPYPQSHLYSMFPFNSGNNTLTRSRDGTYLFLSSIPGTLTRFNMV